MFNYKSYHDILFQELDRRKSLNNSYSLRAFARDLDISASGLSQILSRKQGVSIKVADKIVGKLTCSENEKKWFCESVGALHARSSKVKIKCKSKIDEYENSKTEFSVIQLEYFKVISDWHHFAILELTHIKGFKSDFT